MIQKILTTWDRHWHRPISLEQLGLLRLMFFSLALAYYFGAGASYFQVERLSELDEVLWIPVSLFKLFSLKPLSYTGLLALKYVWALSLVFSAIGFFTRWSTAVAALLGFYLLGLFGNYGQYAVRDNVLVLSLFAFMLLPSGEFYSVDRRLGRIKNQAFASGWPAWLVMDYFLLAYFIAFILKITITGLRYVSTDFISTLFVLYGTPVGIALAPMTGLTRALGAATLILEACTLLAVFSHRLRRWVLFGLAIMHVGIELTLDLHFYPYYFCFLWFILISEQKKLPMASVPPYKIYFVRGFTLLFVALAAYEPVMKFNWPLSHMKYFTFAITGPEFTVENLSLHLSSGRSLTLIQDAASRPLERHMLMWGTAQLYDERDTTDRLDRALKFWLAYAPTNLSLAPGERAVGLSYEKRHLLADPQYLQWANPVRTEILHRICEPQFINMCRSPNEVPANLAN